MLSASSFGAFDNKASFTPLSATRPIAAREARFGLAPHDDVDSDKTPQGTWSSGTYPRTFVQ